MRRRGMVKDYRPDKGYGFIVLEENGENRDVFVHCTEIESQGPAYLVEGQIVEFELAETQRGLRAGKVKVVS